MVRLAAALVAAALTAASGALAQEEARLSVDDIIAAMGDAGLPVNESQVSSDSAFISSEIGGLVFAVFGFNCAGEPTACTDYMFSSYFVVDEPVSLETINDFNERAVAGRAYVDDDGDANIEVYFAATDASAASVVSTYFDVWAEVFFDFARTIGYIEDETPDA
ncbi:MAG: YbjN domain-containing protein [Pseudomonadota bacterium]